MKMEDFINRSVVIDRSKPYTGSAPLGMTLQVRSSIETQTHVALEVFQDSTPGVIYNINSENVIICGGKGFRSQRAPRQFPLQPIQRSFNYDLSWDERHEAVMYREIGSDTWTECLSPMRLLEPSEFITFTNSFKFNQMDKEWFDELSARSMMAISIHSVRSDIGWPVFGFTDLWTDTTVLFD